MQFRKSGESPSRRDRLSQVPEAQMGIETNENWDWAKVGSPSGIAQMSKGTRQPNPGVSGRRKKTKCGEWRSAGRTAGWIWYFAHLGIGPHALAPRLEEQGY